MKYLFVHQNFPGQFKYLAPTLAKDKNNHVLGFAMNGSSGNDDLRVINYKPNRSSSTSIHPWVK